jgi:hypothetical protein
MIPRLDAKRLQTILKALYGAESKQVRPSPLAWPLEQVENLLVRWRGKRTQT